MPSLSDSTSPPSKGLGSHTPVRVLEQTLPPAAGLFSHVANLGTAEENWTGITEQAKRRRLQNRLNQRARRQRLLSSQIQHHHQVHDDLAVVPAAPLSNSSSKSLPPCRLGQMKTRAQLQDFAIQAFQSYQLGTLNPIHLHETVRVNVYRALVCNVNLLGFDDAWLNNDAVSPFGAHAPTLPPALSTDCPDTLRPTSLQVSVAHHPWIDLFPCPRMRDNFLMAVVVHGEDAVDEDALCVDVVDGGGGPDAAADALIAWTDPWSPHGWEVTESFLQKWGWLVHGCVEMQAGTNAWRYRRGLRSLQFPGCS